MIFQLKFLDNYFMHMLNVEELNSSLYLKNDTLQRFSTNIHFFIDSNALSDCSADL